MQEGTLFTQSCATSTNKGTRCATAREHPPHFLSIADLNMQETVITNLRDDYWIVGLGRVEFLPIFVDEVALLCCAVIVNLLLTDVAKGKKLEDQAPKTMN